MPVVLVCLIACGCNMPRRVQTQVLPPAPAEIGDQRAPRAGSALAADSEPEAESSKQPPGDEAATDDDQAIAALMAEINQVDQLDDAAKEQLLADLKKTPRAQWPLIVNMLRATRDQKRPAVAPQTKPEATPGVVEDFVVIEPSKDAAPAEPLLAESKPTPPTTPVRPPAIPTADAAKPPAEPDAIAVSKRNVLRAEGASGDDPIAQQNPIRSSAYPGTDQPPLDPPPKPSDDGVKLASVESDVPLAAPSALPPAAVRAKPTSWNAALDETIAMLEGQSGDHDPATQARLRLLYLAAGRRNDANREIPGVPEDAKAYWSEQLYGLGLYLDDKTTPNARQRATRAAHHARTAAYRLGQLGNLIVRNMAMATAVYSYGVFDELREYNVAAGQEVILYAELENFTSEETAKGYHTSLKANYEIIDRRGSRVAGASLGDSEEYCRNLRRDFFVAYSVVIPSDLHSGEEYTLQLNIEDAKSQRVGESITKFRVQK